MSVSGDGGFLYACGELATAAQERIPLTAVIVDDGGYGMLRFDQDLKGDPRAGVDLHTPDFVALARSFGVRADAVDGLGERFEAMLGHHLRLDEPTVLVRERGPAAAAQRLAPLVSQLMQRGRRRRAARAGSGCLARGPAHPQAADRGRERARSCTPPWRPRSRGSSPPSWSGTIGRSSRRSRP